MTELFQELPPPVGAVHYSTIWGQYIGYNELAGDMELSDLLAALYEFRERNSLPSVSAQIYQPKNILVYIQFEDTVTVLYPEHSLGH